MKLMAALTRKSVLVLIFMLLALFVGTWVLFVMFRGFGNMPKDCDGYVAYNFFGVVEDGSTGEPVPEAQITIGSTKEEPEDDFCRFPIMQDIQMLTNEQGKFSYPDSIIVAPNDILKIAVVAENCELFERVIGDLHLFVSFNDNDAPGIAVQLNCDV
jgi:hypothetical protein